MRFPLFLCVFILLGLACQAQQANEPAAVINEYYVHLNDRDLKAAYQLKSPAARKAKSLEAFRKDWQTCESVGFYQPPELISNDGRKAVLKYRIGSVDALGKDKLRYGQYQMRATLSKGQGRWWIDAIEVVDKNQVEDAPRFEVDRPDLPVPMIPKIPVIGGFTMGEPVAQKSLPDGKIRYVVRCRKRIRGVDPESTAREYLKEMPIRGWKLESDLAGGSSAVGVSFSGVGWKVAILVTSTTWGGTDAPIDPRGTLLQFAFEKS